MLEQASSRAPLASPAAALVGILLIFFARSPHGRSHASHSHASEHPLPVVQCAMISDRRDETARGWLFQPKAQELFSEVRS